MLYILLHRWRFLNILFSFCTPPKEKERNKIIELQSFLFQDSQDPLANSLLMTQFPGTLVLELDWLPVRTDKNDPLVLCIAGADSSFRLIQVNMYASHLTKLTEQLALFSSFSMHVV